MLKSGSSSWSLLVSRGELIDCRIAASPACFCSKSVLVVGRLTAGWADKREEGRKPDDDVSSAIPAPGVKNPLVTLERPVPVVGRGEGLLLGVLLFRRFRR